MPDKRSKQKQRERRLWLGPRSRRLRIYADEDISSWIVDQLRAEGVNVLTTQEAGNAGKDDGWQSSFAASKRRVLLTHNEKHFGDDRRLSLSATLGVIALVVDRSDSDAYAFTASVVSQFLVPWAELYERMKIRVTTTAAGFRFIERGALKQITLTIEELDAGRYPTDDVVDAA